jgi:hypothetical protein
MDGPPKSLGAFYKYMIMFHLLKKMEKCEEFH